MQTQSPNYRIVVGSLRDKIDLNTDITSEHWEEIALNKQVMVLKPNKSRYEAMEREGSLLSLFVYVDDEIVGYSVNIVNSHLHYSDLIVCQNDLLFLKQEYRNGRLGLALIKETEKQAKAYGAQMMLWHAKYETTFHKLLTRLGYGIQDIMMSRVL